MATGSEVQKIEGIVLEALPGLLFRVALGAQESGHEILAHLGGKLKLNRIRVIPGDRVVVEMTRYDDRRGRIVRRL
ncbi:translation initiation factor IF-1 [Candidatus Jorgensenbacteria bacterium]|nr:translation initiation factor IF-1 [Candidatus Jorgensenbacteria bacterium]